VKGYTVNLLLVAFGSLASIGVIAAQPSTAPDVPETVVLAREVSGTQLRLRLEFNAASASVLSTPPRYIVSKEVLESGESTWTPLRELTDVPFTDVELDGNIPASWGAPRSSALEYDVARQLVVVVTTFSFHGKTRVGVRAVPILPDGPRPAGWKEGEAIRSTSCAVINPPELAENKALVVRQTWIDENWLRIELLPSAEAEPSATLELDAKNVLLGPARVAVPAP
jgi:hypothetical protein